MFDYFYGQSGEMFSYFRVPKILFRDIKFKDLSTDAKTLYGILLDRMGLSAKNGLIITRFSTVAIFRPESAAFLNRNCWSSCIRNSTVLSPWIITATACLSAMLSC